MLDITALSNALRDGSVSFVSSLGARPYLDDAEEVVRIRGENALIVPLGMPGDVHPRYALRLPLEPGGGSGWPARYADVASAAGTIVGHLPAGVTILDIDEIRGTPIALLYDWVPGETLTARVTRSRERHARDRLAELLGPLADIAEALRVSGMVHGDVAPGNVIVRPDGAMTLVDLDRMGYRDAQPPVEPRRRAGYRLPRGGGSPEAEDAFALLVLMTSVAILADASVPIDHERAPEWSHPTLLFSSWDLMDPQRSRLVREIEGQLTALTRELLDRLIAASTGRPDQVPALLRDAVRLVRRAGTQPSGEPVGVDDAEEGWHLAGPGGESRVNERELPDLDFGWPTAPEASSRSATGWPEPPGGDDFEPEAPATWPQVPPAGSAPAPGERSIQAIVDEVRAIALPPERGGPSRRQRRAEQRRQRVGERLRRALAEDDRPVLVELAMSGALAELGESDRQDVLQVVRALSHDAIARAIATDDDEAVLASIDATVFADDEELDPSFRDRVRLARERAAWTERAHAAARARDGRACADLLGQVPADGIERLPEAVRRQVTRLAEEQAAVEAARAALRRQDANGLAGALGRLVSLRPAWTDRVDAAEVIELLGMEQIERRLVGVLAGGTVADSDQWMVDLVIAAGRLPEVTRLAGLSPRDVDRMVHRKVEES